MSAVDIDTHVTDDRTVIDVNGTRDVAIVARSAAGERVFLPPEGFDEDLEPSTYRSPYQSAYSRSDDTESPYREAPESTRGVIETAEGFRVLYDEPVTEIDVYREI
ncbi:DUF7510 family protein [Halorubrum sp. DTA98]|uniref:DUF7510 family protein n=1 Tax=Halorubrum sp. DTA98 TaxID=3402163 RepID=UPI003AAF0171